MAEQGDSIGVTTEGVDLGADPAQSLDLIADPEVARDVDIIRP